MHLVLKALSDPETKLDLQKSRRIMNLKILEFLQALLPDTGHEDLQ